MSAKESSAIAPAALSPADAAQYLGVSRPTIDRLRKTGKLAASKIGCRVVIRVEVLDDYLRKTEAVA